MTLLLFLAGLSTAGCGPDCDRDPNFHIDLDDESGQEYNILDLFNHTNFTLVSLEEAGCGTDEWAEVDDDLYIPLASCGQFWFWLEPGCRDVRVVDDRGCSAQFRVDPESGYGLTEWDVENEASDCRR